MKTETFTTLPVVATDYRAAYHQLLGAYGVVESERDRALAEAAKLRRELAKAQAYEEEER